MGRTKPRLPVDEVPIDRAVLSRILALAPGEMILVGGQALAFWMIRFGIGPKPGGDSPMLAAVSSDVDFLGSIEHALVLAQGLGARLVKPDQLAMTSLVGQIRINASSGLEYNVDVLHQIFDIGGLRKSIAFTRRVRKRAALVQMEDGKTVRILHPVDVLASRVQNAAGLLDAKGPHVITQARWAIKVARHALERLAKSREPHADRPGQLASEVFRLATSRAGRIMWDAYQLEIADAIPFAMLIEHVDGFEKQAIAMIDALGRAGRKTGFTAEGGRGAKKRRPRGKGATDN